MFYLREDISRILPQKRYATKEGPGYAMQVSVKAAHAKYNFENPNLKVSLGKFAALRRRNVRLLSKSHRDYCCCPYCTNIRFKLLTLSRASPDLKCKKTHENDIVEVLLCPKADSDQFHDVNCINGGCDKCSNYVKTLKDFYSQIPEDKILTWNRWINDTNSGKGMVKKVVITEKGSKNKLIQEMVEKDIKKPAQGYTFFQHMFTAQWQNLQFRQIKANVPAGSVLQVMDFAKNREIKYQSEIKGAFYTARQVTMHPVVTYFQSDVGLVRNSSIVISEDNCHDYHAVNHFGHIVNRHIGKFMEPNRRIIFSDGCSSQYKSKGPFADIANERTEINRNYYGSEHGKNECDGEIGVLNRSLDRAIIGNAVVLNSAEDVYNYCHSNLEVDDMLSTRNFFYVKIGEINRNRPETDVKTVPSTRKFHQILNSTDEHDLINVRNLSCFCVKCESGDLLSCLNRKYVGKYEVKRLQRNAVPFVNTEENVDSPTVQVVNEEENHAGETSVNVDIKVSENESQAKLESPDSDPFMHSRQGFFELVLSKMCQYKSFDDLQNIAPTIEEEVKELYGDIYVNPDISVVSHGLTVDRLAHEQEFDNRTIEAADGKLPVCVQGDGNCLPRSGSILAFGDEDHHTEIRCRIAIEMVTNRDLYLSVEHLQKGNDNLEKEAKQLVKTYAMFTEHYIPGKRLVPRNIYEKEVMETCKDKTYMGIWQIFALSSVLHCQIFSMYPQLGSELYRTTLNRLVTPRLDDGSGIGYIMWSSTRQDMTSRNWMPNHFVPVVNTTVSSSGSLVEEMIEEDKAMFELDSSTLSGILKDLNDEELADVDILEDDVAPGQSVSSETGQDEFAEVHCHLTSLEFPPECESVKANEGTPLADEVLLLPDDVEQTEGDTYTALDWTTSLGDEEAPPECQSVQANEGTPLADEVLLLPDDIEQSEGDTCTALDWTTSLGDEEAPPECQSVQANEGTPLADEVLLLPDDVEQSEGDTCTALDGTTSLGDEEAPPECQSVQANEGTPVADEVLLLPDDVEQSEGDTCTALDGTTSLGDEEAPPECQSVQVNEGTPLTDEVILLPGYMSGEYLLIKHGKSLFPAVVDEWPYVHFFKTSRKNMWVMNEIKHTIVECDVERRLDPPDISLLGSRLLYTFNSD